MLTLSNELITCIDNQGSLLIDHTECKPNIEKCEALAKAMLGCTLHIRERRFIIRMLEIYYGGLADDAHDWYRTRYTYKTSKYKEHTGIQSEEGFRVYISSLDPNDTYARFDIVVGPAGVPISFLIRSVWDEDFNIIGAKSGSPNIVLRKMLLPSDHGSVISQGNDNVSSIHLEDTHEEILSNRKLTIKQGKRINLKSTFEEKHNVNWNFYLD